MTQDMTEMLLSERDIECKIAQGNSPSVKREMNRSKHTLGILKEYAKSMPTLCLRYAYAMPTTYFCGFTRSEKCHSFYRRFAHTADDSWSQ